MELHDVYFYTDTITGFKQLLQDDNMKLIIISSLSYLVDKKLIKIYGFVIMPNHIHLLWTHLNNNGKESPGGSFTKFTAHRFKKYLQATNPSLLQGYLSIKRDRQYEFWKRDPLAVPLSTIEIIEQKLEYIHRNPVMEKWNLARLPEQYRWSSANFYLNGVDEFNLLTHYCD